MSCLALHGLWLLVLDAKSASCVHFHMGNVYRAMRKRVTHLGHSSSHTRSLVTVWSWHDAFLAVLSDIAAIVICQWASLVVWCCQRPGGRRCTCFARFQPCRAEPTSSTSSTSPLLHFTSPPPRPPSTPSVFRRQFLSQTASSWPSPHSHVRPSGLEDDDSPISPPWWSQSPSTLLLQV